MGGSQVVRGDGRWRRGVHKGFQQRRPHLCFLAPKHRAGDWGMSIVDVITKEQRDELFKSLISAVQHKQEKVGTSRWFQFIHAMESFLKIWSKRQCIGLYCSLQLGLFAKGAAALKVHLKPRDADQDVEKVQYEGGQGRGATSSVRCGKHNKNRDGHARRSELV